MKYKNKLFLLNTKIIFMDTNKFLWDILNFGNDWHVKNVDKREDVFEIHIYMEYTRDNIIINNDGGENILRIY